AIAVDPDRAQSKLGRRSDVVEVTLGDVHMPVARRAGLLEEARPVRVLWFERAELRRDDRKLERDSDPYLRRLDEVPVCVGEDRELPASAARILERRRNLRERLPRGQRFRQPGGLPLRRTELTHRVGHDLPIAARATGLKQA